MHKPAFRWQRKSLFLLGNGVSHQKLKMPHMLQDMLQHVLSILRQDEISQENFFCLRESDHVPKMRGNKDFKTYAFFHKKIDRDRTRTCNPQFRSLVPYPLGHTVSYQLNVPHLHIGNTSSKWGCNIQMAVGTLALSFLSWKGSFSSGVVDASYIARYVANPL